jgi:fluoride exporter
MVVYGILSVGVGAMLGAWLRWALSVLLNPIVPMLPLGTLGANLIGGYLIGLVLGYIEHFQTLSPEMRLFVTTGFLGGLTTFSTFSAETAALLLRQEYLWATLMIGAHLIGSLAMTLLGVGTVALLRSWFAGHG